jgi:hypothetical protein
MLAEAGIAFFDGLSERKKDGFGVVERIDEKFLAEESLNAGEEGTRADGLGYELVGAGLEGSYFGFGIVGGRQDEDGQEASGSRLFEHAAELNAGLLGDGGVYKNEVDAMERDGGEGFLGVGGFEPAAAGLVQERTDVAERLSRTVDKKYVASWGENFQVDCIGRMRNPTLECGGALM